MSHVFLIGFMGAGKSTVGRLLAERLGRTFVDLDTEIVACAGRTIPEIFDAEGEEGFRARESAALAAVVDAPASVVACGGGVVLAEDNRRRLRQTGTVVYLKVSAGEALARIGDTTGRPLLERADAVQMAGTLLQARESFYRTLADAVVDTSGRTPAEVAESVARVIDMLPRGEVSS